MTTLYQDDIASYFNALDNSLKSCVLKNIYETFPNNLKWQSIEAEFNMVTINCNLNK